ncbi:MAG: hypothetical protein D6813_15160 [Calditrichaeota bacterium]|nr:MAG: hypothetical protein D6813_15160 [Calditrichota bacterium]
MKKYFVFLSLIGLFLGGCLGRKEVFYKYYLVEFPTVRDSTLSKNYTNSKFSCEILPVEIHPAYSSTRIAVRMNSHELDYFAYHRWAVRPAELFVLTAENYLRESHLFASVSTQIRRRLPEFQVKIKIQQLEAIQQDKKFSAHLNLELQLLETTSGEILITEKSNSIQPLPENDLNLFASTISQIYLHTLNRFAEKISSYFQSTSSQKSLQ